MKEGSPVEILWCVENPKGQAVLSVLLLCQGTGSNPGHAPALPALSSAGPPGQEAANANVGKVI